MQKTEQHLAEAFAGESQANRRYLAFAQQAEEEGFPQVAKLFRAAADAETVHALNHLREMEGVRSTRENLEAAIDGESYEFRTMYPKMIAAAKAEGKEHALRSFRYANEVEKVHANLFKKAHKYLGDNEPVNFAVCQVCGNTVEGEAPEQCPVCGVSKDRFRTIA